MKVAILSDIHGDRWALEAVLNDIVERGIDRLFNLGDSFYGSLYVNGTFELLQRKDMVSISGNEERIILENLNECMKTPTLHYVCDRLNGHMVDWLNSLKETCVIDEGRTPTVKTVEAWLAEAGFEGVVSEGVVQKSFDSCVAYLNAIDLKNTSVLSLISLEEFEAGIHGLAKYINEDPNDSWLLYDRLALTVGYKCTSE